MQKNIIKSVLLLTPIMFITACARDLSSNTYTDSSTTGLVVEGTVVSKRDVKVKGSDKLQNNGVGIVSGGVGGAVAGSTIGGGRGSAVTAVGGALAGAAIGSLIQDQLSESEGIEYIVKVRKENLAAKSKTKDDLNVTISNSSVSSKVKNSVDADMNTELVSIVQGKDIVIPVGQKVYVIYSDDRPRIVPVEK